MLRSEWLAVLVALSIVVMASGEDVAAIGGSLGEMAVGICMVMSLAISNLHSSFFVSKVYFDNKILQTLKLNITIHMEFS